MYGIETLSLKTNYPVELRVKRCGFHLTYRMSRPFLLPNMWVLQEEVFSETMVSAFSLVDVCVSAKRMTLVFLCLPASLFREETPSPNEIDLDK